MLHNHHRDRITSRHSQGIARTGHASAGTDPDTAANARSAALAMIVAFVLFAIFASDGLRHFSRDLPGNRATDILVDGADHWHRLMLRLGPAHVGPAVREAFSRVRAARW